MSGRVTKEQLEAMERANSLLSEAISIMIKNKIAFSVIAVASADDEGVSLLEAANFKEDSVGSDFVFGPAVSAQKACKFQREGGVPIKWIYEATEMDESDFEDIPKDIRDLAAQKARELAMSDTSIEEHMSEMIEFANRMSEEMQKRKEEEKPKGLNQATRQEIDALLGRISKGELW